MCHAKFHRISLILSASLIFFLFSGIALADVGKGLLWRIHKPKVPASYLYGTIHVDDKRVKRLSEQVRKRFDESKTLCLEILPDRETQVGIGLAMLLPEGIMLDGVLGDALFTRLSLELNRKGITPMEALRLKPWAAMVALSRPESQGGYALDEQLYHWANYQYKRMCALETLQEQLSVFDELTHVDQIALLEETLDHLPKLKEMNEELIQIYLKGDLDAIFEKSMELNRVPDKGLSKRLRESLIDRRNEIMIKRMKPYLEKGRAFIAVGALHLPGDKGLIRLLVKEGYAVTPPDVALPPW